MSAVVINSGLVHYEAFGRGRKSPILFLHGWLGSWRYWMPAMESLSIEHRAYAIDLWGFGDSDKNEQRFTIDQYVSLVDSFVDNMGMENPVIVGHSLGAVIALEYSRRAKIDKIVAVSLPLDSSAINRRLPNFNSSSTLSKVFRWNPIPNKDVEQEALRADKSVIGRTLESLTEINVADVLASLKTNVLLVYGEKDDVVDPAVVDQLNGEADNVRAIILPSSKHFPMIDESSKFNRLLKDFAENDVTIESLTLKEEWRRRVR